jgi:thermostable 8-oxoguanine DNA glycosylase
MLHEIDRPFGPYDSRDTERLMVFCILDRAQEYRQVGKAFDALDRVGLTTRRGLEKARGTAIRKVLKEAGYRFPNQTARYLKEFGSNPINLRSATREELVKSITGIGLKLASMFVRNTRGERVAVLDVHIRNWLRERYGRLPRSYYEQEKLFMKAAEELGQDPGRLDIDVWEARRRKHGD